MFSTRSVHSLAPTAPPFHNILDEEIADGDASHDTIKTYTKQFKLFVSWCAERKIELIELAENHVKEYRRYLVSKKLKPTTIALKLTVIRRIFEIAVERGLMATNPAAKVKPPKLIHDPADNNNYLELEEAQKLVDFLPKGNSMVELRDRLLVLLMVRIGCRQIGLYRLNVGDIIRKKDRVGLRVTAKGRVRVVPLTPDVAKILEKYLEARRANDERLTKDTPMFISVSRNSARQRLTRRSMQTIVNDCLEKASLKHSETRTVTSHGLRHTVGYLLTQAGKSLRVVQEALGHADPRTTAIYAHIVNLWNDNPFDSIAISSA
ncbi:MAG: tyrosine-type recombinase/integrase [Prochloraceae cyanobacterium]|nr:tyrosine-type recombinase/integrase [Prochloraceae cyanobacterium]